MADFLESLFGAFCIVGALGLILIFALLAEELGE